MSKESFYNWSQEQAKQHLDEKSIHFIFDVELHTSEYAYVIYELTLETLIGIYTYIGQTKDLERRILQHSEVFNITTVRVLEGADSREDALRKEKAAILDASDEYLLNQQHNIFYAEGTRNRVIKSLSKHLIGT